MKAFIILPSISHGGFCCPIHSKYLPSFETWICHTAIKKDTKWQFSADTKQLLLVVGVGLYVPLHGGGTCMSDTAKSVDPYSWWWSSKIHIDGIILMRKRNIAGENLPTTNTVKLLTAGHSQCVGVAARTICNLSLLFSAGWGSSPPPGAGREP